MEPLSIARSFDSQSNAVLYRGDCRTLLSAVPDEFVQLIVTSPPYNIGKAYERKVRLYNYIEQQREIIEECARVLSPAGSICWQVGNYVHDGEIVPLDIILYPIFRELGLRLRNRIIWRFEHGLHCKQRLSGRYETILWFTKSKKYVFHLDPLRIPQKYPQKKHFKGPRAGQYSCHPLGKNPGDVWDIPNVKSNHVEKTIHPCQFPVELVERLVLALSNERDWVLDPFAGVGSTGVGAIRHGRKTLLAEIDKSYAGLARNRLKQAWAGTLKTRPLGMPIYDPDLPNGGQVSMQGFSKLTHVQLELTPPS